MALITPTTVIDTYLEVFCTPSSDSTDCTTYSTPPYGAFDYTALASYMQATLGVLSGGEVSNVLVWQTAPPSVLTSWQSVIAAAAPSGFAESDAAPLATFLADYAQTPEWILQMPLSVQTYFVSAVLPSYTTPMTYYEYELYTGEPIPSSSSGTLSTTLPQGSNSTAPSSAPLVWVYSTTETISASSLDAISPYATTEAAPTPNAEASVSKSLSPAITAAISVPIAFVALLLICWAIFYYKRIRPARTRSHEEAEQPPAYRDEMQKMDLYSSEAAVSSSKMKPEPRSVELPAIAFDPAPLSELEGTDAAATSTFNTPDGVIKELDGASSASRSAAGVENKGCVDATSSAFPRHA